MNASTQQETASATPSVEPAPADRAAPATDPAPASGGRWLMLVFGLLLLLGIAAGLTAGYRYWLDIQADLRRLDGVIEQAAQEQARLDTRIETAQTAFAEQRSQIEQQQVAFQAQQQALQQEREKLRLQEEAVAQALAAAERVGAAADTDWMLAEAAYLMRLAQSRLALERDVAGARTALGSADERLRATGNPRWAEVREVLASEQSALASVPQPDLTRLGVALDQLIADAAGLHLGDAADAASEVAAAAQPSQPSPRSVATLPQDLWSGFSALMAVRRHDQPAPGPQTFSKELYLQENFRLQLEASRAALSRGNAELYRRGLQAALAWVDEFADPEAALSAALRQRLQALAAVEIRPPLPDISASLRMLERRRAEAQEGEAR